MTKRGGCNPDVQSRGAEWGGAAARQGCSEALGAFKSGRGIPQSKTLRVFGGVGERSPIEIVILYWLGIGSALTEAALAGSL